MSLAHLYLQEDKYDDARTHIEHAKSHAGFNILILASVLVISANISYAQNRLEDGKSEAFRALDIYEKLRATYLAESTIEIEKALRDDGRRLKWCSLSRPFTPLNRTQKPNPNDGGESCLIYLGRPLQGPHSPAPSLIFSGNRYYPILTSLLFLSPRERPYPPRLIPGLSSHSRC